MQATSTCSEPLGILADARMQVRDVMVTGFVVAFLPVLAGAFWGVHALWAVWAAKAAHNVWRLAGAALRIHWQIPRAARAALDARASSA